MQIIAGLGSGQTFGNRKCEAYSTHWMFASGQFLTARGLALGATGIQEELREYLRNYKDICNFGTADTSTGSGSYRNTRGVYRNT